MMDSTNTNSTLFLECGIDVSEHTITFVINTLIDLCTQHKFQHKQGKLLHLLNKLRRLRAYSDYEHLSVSALLGEISEIIMFHSSSYFALPLLFEQLKLTKRQFGCDHHDLAFIYYNIGQIYDKYDKLSEAKKFYEDASCILAKSKLGGRREAAVVYSIALFNYSQKLYSEAFENFNIVINYQRQIMGDFHPKVAEMQLEVGKLVLKNERPEEALENYLLEALVIMRMHVGNDHSKVSEILYQIGKAHKLKGENIEALNAFKQALRASGDRETRSKIQEKMHLLPINMEDALKV